MKIVGFLCNWCSYGGADTAGVCRFKQPTDLRIVRIPCTGRMDPLFVAKSLIYGADGVLVSGCHPRDCHYSVGNFHARRRLEVLRASFRLWVSTPAGFIIPGYPLLRASAGKRW